MDEIDPDILSDAVGEVPALLEPGEGLGWPDLDRLLDELSAEEAISLKKELIPVALNLNGKELEEEAG